MDAVSRFVSMLRSSPSQLPEEIVRHKDAGMGFENDHATP